MSQYVWGNSETEHFYKLGPNEILNAVEYLGIKTTGRVLALNSMENRVLEVEIDHDPSTLESASDAFRIIKFYRPGRWSKEQILDEHEFLFDLYHNDIPVIPPIKFDGKSLFDDKETGLMYCIFRKKGGRSPQEMTTEQLQVMGRLLARVHATGVAKEASNRIRISPDTFGKSNLNFLLQSEHLPKEHHSQYQELVLEICDKSNPLFNNVKYQRIHGDCHLANILWGDNGPFLVDFDDMLVGPPVQDIWPILPGRDEESVSQRSILLEAYEDMYPFQWESLALIEPLRAFRLIHFCAWKAKRWEDPSFQQAFPFFKEQSFWPSHINNLREQLMLMNQRNEHPY